MTYAPITGATLLIWCIATSPIWAGLAIVAMRFARERRNR